MIQRGTRKNDMTVVLRHHMRRTVPSLLVFAAVFFLFPSWWCGRESAQWLEEDSDLPLRLARAVAHDVRMDLGTGDYTTGDPLFDGEWLFGTHMMAGTGLARMVLVRPETRDEFVPVIRHCIEQLLSPEVREFDRNSWKRDALENLEADRGHAAYLGYFNFMLGMARLADIDFEHGELHDAITDALVRRLRASPNSLVETYPREWYPVDNCAVVGSIGLHGYVTGADHSLLIREWETVFRSKYVDSTTGLMIQAVNEHGAAIDEPRGSGTSLGLFLVEPAAPGLSADLYRALRQELAGNVVGFGAIREYPRGIQGSGDIDSGPVILGWSFSATGFSIAGARMYGDKPMLRRLYASAYLAGVPVDRADHRRFLTAGPLGNAILLAMLTAPATKPDSNPQ